MSSIFEIILTNDKFESWQMEKHAAGSRPSAPRQAWHLLHFQKLLGSKLWSSQFTGLHDCVGLDPPPVK